MEKNKFIHKIKNFNELGVLLTLVGICLIIGVFNPVFFTGMNAMNVLRQIAVMAIIAVGEGFVIITSGIDLSVGSMLSLGGVLCAALCANGFNPWLALVAAVLIGAGLGLFSGAIIVVFRINPFIATLAMLNIVKGIAYLITQGLPITFDTSLNFLGVTVAGIPISGIIMLFIVLLGHMILTKTEFGRMIFAVGGNERAAKLSGIKVEKVKLAVYAIVAALASFAGILSAANLSSADVAMGSGYELDVIAAVVIGGCSLAGGQGSIAGVLIGSAILGVIRNGFVLLRIPSYWQTITIGAVIIIACALDQVKKRKH